MEMINLSKEDRITDYEFVSVEENFIIVKDNDLYGVSKLIGKTTKLSDIIKPQFRSIEKTINNLYIISNKNNRYGLIDSKGNVIVEPKYLELYPFGDFFLIKDNDKEGLDNDKEGLLDKDGKVIVDLKYDKINPFENGFAIVFKGGSYGMINEEGREVIKPVYDQIRPYRNGLVPVLKGKYWGVYNSNWDLVMGFEFEQLCRNYDDYLCYIDKRKHFGIIDKNGNTTFDKKIRGYVCIDPVGNNNFLVQYKGKTKIIDSNAKKINKIACDPWDDDEFKYLNHNRFFLKGLLYDSNGDQLSEEYHEKIDEFHNGYAIFEDSNAFANQKNGIIDYKGKKVTDELYNVVKYLGNYNYLLRKPYIEYRFYNVLTNEKSELVFRDYEKVTDSLYTVFIEDETYLYNIKNQKKLRYTYKTALPNGYYRVQNGGQSGLFDEELNEIMPIKYKYFDLLIEKGYFILSHVNSYSLLDKDGNEIFKEKQISSLHVLSDDILIVNNCLVKMQDFIDKKVVEKKEQILEDNISDYKNKLEMIKKFITDENLMETIDEVIDNTNKIENLIDINKNKLLSLKKKLNKDE